MDILYLQNDNLLQLDRVRDADGAFANAATVVCTAVLDAAGVAVSGISVPLAMTYVPGSSGRYRATLQDTGIFVHGQEYSAVITVDGGGLQAKFHVPFKAQTRTTR